MKNKLILLFAAVSLVSCSPSIVNSWNIDKYEVIKKGQSTTSNNIGTISFNSDGKGVKDINYNVFQNDYSDKSQFSYELHEDYIIIKSAGEEQESHLNKTWIIVSDKSKKQVWKSTDGQQSVQVLELSRE
ncbi:hypothetical protein SAMN04488096_102186 [Mesonia phycicola]|uniref:Lipocalin-like domain-containing protein n=1 Tax=Mesonia phycicola TaxID=579105 RepID=A0A1M6BRV3_9FLAO|nr:hypothetical protein [Mesonia phycicola]SHI51334.1 hypothetical protein SAMN04488096_102186 [Mesonia phycicola]